MEVYEDCSKSPSGKDNKYKDLDLFDCLPFFACPNKIYDHKCWSDVRRFIYCKQTQTQPYPGPYGSQPRLWIDKYFALQNLDSLKELRAQERKSQAMSNKGLPLK